MIVRSGIEVVDLIRCQLFVICFFSIQVINHALCANWHLIFWVYTYLSFDSRLYSLRRQQLKKIGDI